MFPPSSPNTERHRINSERQYREYQLRLKGNSPVKRFKDEPNLFSRVAHTIRRLVPTRQAETKAASTSKRQTQNLAPVNK